MTQCFHFCMLTFKEWSQTCSDQAMQRKTPLDPLMIKLIRLRNFFLTFFFSFKISPLIYSNILCTFLIPFEIMRGMERRTEREGGGVRASVSGWRKEEANESERTKCNLSAYSDSQCLKWELTENIEDCSLIGQGHSWHFQAKLQCRWWERMCHNYKWFSLPSVLMSRFTQPFLFSHNICIIFHLHCAVLLK